MQKKSRMKATAILLVLCLVLSLIPAPVWAVEVETTEPENTYNLQDAIAGLVDYTELYDPLDPATVPDVVGYENAVSKYHVQRLYAEEGDDLNKVVFLNADGSKTLYTYDFPVKYIDENGAIQDISLEIADTLSGYETASSSAITTFSAQATNGIRLSGNDTQITLVPVLPQVTPVGNAMLTATATDTVLAHTAQRVDEKTIEYRYDAKTTIEYSLTYTGFKEDIVVSEYTGQTEYDFRLHTNGLTLTEMDGSFFLVDEAGNIKATIGDIIIFTADERNNTFGQLIPTTIVENEEYLLTIVVDADFLADENTAYPIRIDPTVELNYDSNGAGAIEDVTVHSAATSKGTLGSLYIGLKEGSGVSRGLIKFPGLDLDSMGDNVTVTSATLTMRDLMCESTAMDVECHVFAGNTWTESTANWTNTNAGSSNSISTLLDTVTMDYDIGRNFTNKHWYTFNITKAVQGWLDGNYNPNKGIILKMSDAHESGSTYTYRTIGSYNRSSNKPTFSLTYITLPTRTVDDGTYYFNITESGEYLQLNSGSITGVNGYISQYGNTIQWVVRKMDGGYVIRAAQNQNLYLSVPANDSDDPDDLVDLVIMTTVEEDREIPATCYWSIVLAVGGCIIQSSYNSRYLYIDSAGIAKTNTTFGGYGTEEYHTYVWRLATYSQVSGYELPANAELNTLQLSVGTSGSPTVSGAPTGVIWAEPSDFIYKIHDSTPAHVSHSDGEFTASSKGIVTVFATHRVTNKPYTFAVVVGDIPYLYVNNYYDQGYVVRFGDGDAEVAEETIREYWSVVAKKLRKFFGVIVIPTFSPITSYVDMCKLCDDDDDDFITESELAIECTHSFNHLDSDEIFKNFYAGDSTTIKILWTGHILDDTWGDGKLSNPTSSALPDTHQILITPHWEIADPGNTWMHNLYTLLHEVSHQLGAPDHYCRYYDTIAELEKYETRCKNTSCDICVYGQNPRPCLMTGPYYDVETKEEKDLYCTDCLRTIADHLSDHH